MIRKNDIDLAGAVVSSRHGVNRLFGIPPLSRAVFRMGVGFALALLALWGLLTAPAQAEVTFVSNLNKTTGQNSIEIGNNWEVAQGFTTGSNEDGYTLASVEAIFPTVNSSPTLTVTLHKDLPTNAAIATLNNPDSIVTGTLTFTAPAMTTLEKETTYYVLFNGDNVFMRSTSSDDEDSGGLTDWSIADVRQLRDDTTTGPFTENSASMRIRLKGTVKGTTTNTAPTASDNTVTTDEDTAYTFAATDFNFADDDAGDTLASVKVTSLESAGDLELDGTGVTLNQVITKADIDANKLTFEPAANANGSAYATFGFTVNDGTDDSASAYTMTIDVTAVNDAPYLDNVIPDQSATAGTAFSYTFPANTFGDDDGDTLTYTAAKSDDTALPSWLSFNANTRTFSGTPAAADVGTVSVKVKASDDDNSVNYTFVITVSAAANNPPTASDNTVTTAEDVDLTFLATDFNFADVDGDTLASVKITSLPASGKGTLALDGTDITSADLPQTVTKSELDAGDLVYTPPANGNGSAYATFQFKVNDGTVDSDDAYTMTIDVDAVNDAPSASDNTVTTDEDTTYTFAASDFNFTDVDAGDTLAGVKITTLESAGDLELDGTDVTANQVITKADIDAGDLTFAPAAGASGDPYATFGFKVNDGTADSASAYTMTIDVGVVNDPPTASSNTVTTSEDTAYAFAASDFGFMDDDGDTLASVKVIQLESAGDLELDGTDVTLNQVITKADIDANKLTFTPAENAYMATGYATFTFKVNDGTVDSLAGYTMTISVTPVNDAPTVANAIADQSATVDTAFSFQFAANAFDDVDDSTLTYTATKSDDSALPSWLSFTANTRTFSGTPAVADAGTVSVKVTASDDDGASVSDTFVITVSTVPNNPPTASSATVTTSEDAAYAFAASDFGFMDDDGDTLASVKITTLESAGDLELDGTGVALNQVITKADIDANKLTFTPAADVNGSAYATFGFKVNDGTDDSASTYTMTIDVTAVNDAPTVANAIPDRSATVDAAFSFQFAANAFDDVDDSTLTYTATKSDDSALPSWLSFAANTRTFSGTPAAADAGTVSVKVTASDDDSASVSDTFVITVSATTVCGAVWCGTLTVQNLGSGHRGCANSESQSARKCSTGTTLSEDGFTHDSTSYAVTRVQLRSDGELRLHMSPDLTTASQLLALHAGGRVFYFTDANSHSGTNNRRWFGSGLSWSTGDEVYLELREDPRVDATGAPEIIGSPQVGETLTAGLGTIEDGNGLPAFPSGFEFRWQRDGRSISGATSHEYTVTSEDVGTAITVEVEFTDGVGESESLESAPTALVVTSGTITNTDRMPQAWLARFGRTVADQVLDAVSGRMGSTQSPGTAVQVAGRPVGASPDPGVGASAERPLSQWLRDPSGTSRAPAGRELLGGSSFSLTSGTEQAGFGTLWGRGAVSRFDGREGDLSLDGEVASALLGTDFTRGRKTAGLVVSRSLGEGGYRSPSGGGAVESTLTGVYPWGRYAASERVSVWGVAGYGAGTLTLVPAGQPPLETDLDLVMAVLGGRGILSGAPSGGGLELSVTSDALAVRTSSSAVRGSRGNLAASRGRVTRLRVGLEGTWRGLGPLVPSVAVGARHDGGDAETGFGADLGGRLAWHARVPGLRAELAARGLLTHEDGGLRERGLAGSLYWDPSPASERGPELTLRRTTGAAATGGLHALLGPDSPRPLAAAGEPGPDRRRLETRFGYGFAAFGGTWTAIPEIGLELAGSGREYIHAWRLLKTRSDGLRLRLDFEARHRAGTADREPENRLGIRFAAQW